MEAGKTNKPKKRDRIGVILYVFYVFMLLMSIVLIGGIVYIQLFFRPDKAIVEALTPNDQIRKIDPVRGNIYDCNGKLLAISCPSYQFYMDCTVLKDRNKPCTSCTEDFGHIGFFFACICRRTIAPGKFSQLIAHGLESCVRA